MYGLLPNGTTELLLVSIRIVVAAVGAHPSCNCGLLSRLIGTSMPLERVVSPGMLNKLAWLT